MPPHRPSLGAAAARDVSPTAARHRHARATMWPRRVRADRFLRKVEVQATGVVARVLKGKGDPQGKDSQTPSPVPVSVLARVISLCAVAARVLWYWKLLGSLIPEFFRAGRPSCGVLRFGFYQGLAFLNAVQSDCSQSPSDCVPAFLMTISAGVCRNSHTHNGARARPAGPSLTLWWTAGAASSGC